MCCQVFGSDADELFQAYYQARYIGEVVTAGKREFNIPMYVNVWVDYPAAQLPQRQLDQPGIGYPSGGPVQKLVGLWRKLAPSIDIIGPDIYSDESGLYHDVVNAYHRNDNALWIPETGRSDSFARYFFYALGQGAICFSPVWRRPDRLEHNGRRTVDRSRQKLRSAQFHGPRN